jgi:Polysaccharide pyruvyl transferase
MICQLGTFDVENYGDLLYPLILRYILKKKNTEVRHYSLLGGDGPHQAGFETRPIRSLFQKPEPGPLTLIVGGGDILRTDWDLVARHYGRNSRVSVQGLRRSIGIHGLVGYALHKNLPRLEPNGFHAKRLRAGWMNYPAVGPFLINPENLPAKSSVSYVSCGVPHDFTPTEIESVKRALDQAKFIGLRDEQSAEKLLSAGVTRELKVAPDLTVTLSDQFSQGALIRRGRQIYSRFGVGDGRPVLCFQSQPYPGFSEDDILLELKHYRKRSGADVIAVPLAYCHGDHEFLRSLAKRSEGTVKYADVHSVFDMLAVIVASDVFVGTSLHGNITAFSFGIPHVFGPLPVAKAEGFLRVVNLPVELKMRSWNELNDRIDAALMLGQGLFLERARVAKSKAYQLVDELFQN